MIRLLNLDITTLGIIFVICGFLCIFMALTRRAYAPKLSFLCGIVLIPCGGLMWLLPRCDNLQRFLGHFATLAGGIIFLSIDLINYYKRRQCTVTLQGEFLNISTYGRKNKGLSYGSAIFRYRMNGDTYEQASLDKRSWLTFLKSPFQKKFTAGNYYTIYINPNTPHHFAISRRPHFDLFSYFGAILLAAFFLT